MVTDGGQETKTEGAIKAGDGEYVFDLDELSGLEAGPGYSTAHGPVVEGQRMQVGLMNMAAGTGADLHTHPNEQFIYLLRGNARLTVSGQAGDVSEGEVVYIPANAKHEMAVLSDEDVYFYVVKDLRHGIAGTRVDQDAEVDAVDEATEPGDLETKTDGAVKAGNGNYFFDLDELETLDAGPGYSTSHGPVIEGERVQVGLMRMPKGTGADPHTHPNEQFNYFLQGESDGGVDGQDEPISAGEVKYIPPDTEHWGEVVSDEDVLFFVAKDLTHGIAGSPVE